MKDVRSFFEQEGVMLRQALITTVGPLSVTLQVWPGMFHVWHFFVDRLAAADEALRNGAASLEAALTHTGEYPAGPSRVNIAA